MVKTLVHLIASRRYDEHSPTIVARFHMIKHLRTLDDNGMDCRIINGLCINICINDKQAHKCLNIVLGF